MLDNSSFSFSFGSDGQEKVEVDLLLQLLFAPQALKPVAPAVGKTEQYHSFAACK